MVVLRAPSARRIAAARGRRRRLTPGGVRYAAGALRLLLAATPTPPFRTVGLPALRFTGSGGALGLPVLRSAAVQDLPPQTLAVRSPVSPAMRQFGGGRGVWLAGATLGAAPDAVEDGQP